MTLTTGCLDTYIAQASTTRGAGPRQLKVFYNPCVTRAYKYPIFLRRSSRAPGSANHMVSDSPGAPGIWWDMQMQKLWLTHCHWDMKVSTTQGCQDVELQRSALDHPQSPAEFHTTPSATLTLHLQTEGGGTLSSNMCKVALLTHTGGRGSSGS